MTRYMSRCIDRSIERDLGIFGAVLIQGPKWCGKTTTAQRFAESSLSLSDPAGDFAALQLARIDPAQAIVGATPRLIDEWQEEPKLWAAIRFECDRRTGEPGPNSRFPQGRSRSNRCLTDAPSKRHLDPSTASPISPICYVVVVGLRRLARRLPMQCEYPLPTSTVSANRMFRGLTA